MELAAKRTCEDCGSTDAVRLLDDPGSEKTFALCPRCARALLDDPPDPTAGLTNAEEDPDEEFRDTCITASDYYREGDYEMESSDPRFPDDFVCPNGSFRSTVADAPIPVIYLMADGKHRCADCVNLICLALDPLVTPEPRWRMVDAELIYDGPPRVCAFCGSSIASLFGESSKDTTEELFA